MQHRVPCLSECRWYHAVDLPGIGEVPSEQWDLRADPTAYLGGVDLAGKRILEIGPASGYLTAEMERRGADVVALEIDDAHAWDFVPNAAVLDIASYLRDRERVMTMIKNSWHLVKAANRLRAEIVYGHAEQPTPGLGRFDVCLFGSVMLHLRNPLTVLERCAALTDETVIVAERHFPELGDAPIARLAPSVENHVVDTWWDFTPAFWDRALRLLGFRSVQVQYHAPSYRGTPIPMYTVVASRS